MSKREYKSSVFSMMLENPEYALDAYNAINSSNYTDVNLVTIRRIEGKIVLSVRNDASFLLDAYLNLYEHQSTFNPNMPLRFLLYYADLLKDIIKSEEYNLYGNKLIPIPTPRFVVLYNGIEKQPAIKEFKFSDAFEHKCENYELELKCIMYNINPGYNDDMLGKSKVLYGYTAFVEKVRKYEHQFVELSDAVGRAMDECIEEDILKEFFTEKGREVLEMAELDFTFEVQKRMIARDSREEGIEIAHVNLIKSKLQKGKDIPTIADEVEQSEDYVKELIEKHGLQ